MSRVINIRGTSGAGKSHLVRSIVAHYGSIEYHRREGRKQPIGYTHHRIGDGPPLFVVGHYETACGGADTISWGLDYIYHELIHPAIVAGKDVIFEGLIVASDVTRCLDLRGMAQLLVIGLNTDIDTCVASIQARRDARGDSRQLSPNNTIKKHKAILAQRARFRDAGADFRWLNRAEAYAACVDFLGLTLQERSETSGQPVRV